MSNEIYKIISAGYKAASLGYGNPLMCVVAESTNGKTDTMNAIIRDNSKIFFLPPSSTFVVFDILKDAIVGNDMKFIFVDDKSKWQKNDDFNNAVMMLKNMAEKKLNPSRLDNFHKTMYNINVSVGSALFLNKEQLNESWSQMDRTGYKGRCLYLYKKHTPQDYKYILSMYRIHGYSEENPPYFKVGDNFWKWESEIGTVDDEIDKWISDNYISSVSKTIYAIAKVVTSEGFWSLVPILNKSMRKEDYPEKIEFDFGRCRCEKCRNNGQSRLLLTAGPVLN